MRRAVIERPSSGRRPARRLRHRSALALAAGTATQLTNVVDAIVSTVTHPGVQRITEFAGPVFPWFVAGCTLAFGGLLILGGGESDSLGRRLLVAFHEIYQRALADGLGGGFLVAAGEALIAAMVSPDPEPGLADPLGQE